MPPRSRLLGCFLSKSRNRGAAPNFGSRHGAAVSGCEVVLRSGPIHVRETPPKITPVETVRFPKFQSCFPVASVLHRDAGSPFWFEFHAPLSLRCAFCLLALLVAVLRGTWRPTAGHPGVREKRNVSKNTKKERNNDYFGARLGVGGFFGKNHWNPIGCRLTSASSFTSACW